jgi:TatD DNase family protein
VGVKHIITIGINLEASRKAVALAQQHPNVYATVGFHANYCGEATEDAWRQMQELARQPKVVGIGETGLDFYRDGAPRELQLQWFRKQLDLAESLHLPIVIHNRDATEECLKVLEERKRGHGVMHCFSAGEAAAKRFLALGLYVSFAGQVTYPSATVLRETAKTIPIEKTLIETDCPFLVPEPLREELYEKGPKGAKPRNEPAYVVHTAKRLAELHKLSVSDVGRITSLNAYQVFRAGQAPSKGVIAYTIRNSRYLNVTNRCTNRCTFCARQQTWFVKGHHLKLDQEPSVAEIIAAMGDPTQFDEVVFCGYGEPTMRLDVVKAVAKHVKARGVKTRLVTNGHGNLINRRSIVSELVGLIDHACVSLNTADPKQYKEMCRPEDGDAAYPAMLAFIKECKAALPEVSVTAVEAPGVNVAAVQRFAAQLGVPFRLRRYNVVG